MSSSAHAIIQEFNSLPPVEQLAVYEAIARKVMWRDDVWLATRADIAAHVAAHVLKSIG